MTDRGRSRPARDAALEALLAFGSDAVITVDSNDILLDANGRASELFGVPQADLPGRRVAEFIPVDEDEIPRASQPWRSGPGTGRPVRFARRIVRRSGEVRHCDGTAETLPDGEVLLILRDSTETAARLRDTSHPLTVAASKAPLVLWAVDREMRITMAQGSGLAALRITDPSEMLGRTAGEMFPDLPEANSYCARALAGESLFLRVAARGATFENWYIPVRDDHGSVVAVQGVGIDVTERVRAESESIRIRQSLDEAQHLAGLGSWDEDLATGETRWSHQLFCMFGFEPASFVPARSALLEAISAGDRPAFEDTIERLLQEGGCAEQTLRGQRADGAARVFHVRALISHDPSGSTPRFCGTVQDITERDRARSEIRRAKESLSEAQRVAGVGSWEWTPETGVGFWSDELYRLLGLAPGTAAPSPETLLAAVYEADRATLRSAIEEAQAGRVPDEPVYCRVVRPGGEARHVRILAKLLSHRGDPDRLVGTLQDVTEWRRAQERMSVLSSALEQTADAAYVTDREDVILYVNEAFVLQTGYSREELLGQTTRLLKSGVHTPEFYQAFWQHILSGKIWRGTFVNRRKDGSLYHEEKAITPVRSTDGQVTHFVTTGRDITERMGAEEAQARLSDVIARSANEWRATFDAVDTPILILDAEGRVRRPNRAARDLAGTPYASLMGSSVQDLGADGLWKAMAEAASRVQSEGRATSLQARDAVSGKTWDVSASPLTEPGVKGAVIVLARDVSPIVGLQESLRRMETISAMGRLVAGVAHEVRNPLFAISATLDTLDADLSAHPGYRQYSDVLRGEVSRLTDLMQDLLDYGRPSVVQLERSRLRPVIQRACNASASLARERGVSLEQEVDDDLPEVGLDPGRFRQVIQNLVENGIQHSPVGSVVRVRARSIDDPSRVEIEVIDSGTGFRREDMAQLFEPFYSRRKGGTGLGLSIVQRIVMEHGGEVQVANRIVGGASVVVRLPSLDHA